MSLTGFNFWGISKLGLFPQSTLWLVTAGKAKVLLLTLLMAWFYF